MFSRCQRPFKSMVSIPFIQNRRQRTAKQGGDESSSSNRAGTPAPNGFETRIDKIGRALFYIIFALAPIWFLPLTVFPVAQNKQFLAAILIFVAFILWLVKVLSTGKIVLPKTILSFAVLVFVGITFLSSLLSISPVTSFWGNALQPDTFFSFLVYALSFFMVPVFFTKPGHLLKGVFFFAGSTFILILYSIFQIFGLFILPWDFTKQTGFNPIGSVQALAIFSAYAFSIIIALLTALKLPANLKVALGACGALLAVLLLFVNFRWAWLGVLFAMAVITSWQMMRSRATVPVRLSLPLLILVLSAVLLFLRMPLAGIIKLPVEVSPSYNATFDIAINTIQWPRTFLGSGPATFAYEYSLHRSVDLNYTQFWGVRFNQGIAAAPTMLSTTGLFGFLSFLAIIILFVRAGFKGLSALSGKSAVAESIALGSFAGGGLLLLMWFLYPADFSLLLFAFLSAGILMSILWQGGAVKTLDVSLLISPQRTLLVSLAVIITISGMAVVTYWYGQQYVAAIFYGNGINIFAKTNNLDRTIRSLSTAVNLDSSQDRYRRTLSQALLLKAGEVLRKTGLKPDELQTQFQVALQGSVEVAKRATVVNPVEPFNWSQLASIYENVMSIVNGADGPAIEAYKKVIEGDPKNPQAVLNVARTLVASADKIQNELRALEKSNQQDKERVKSLQEDYASRLEEASQYLNHAIELKTDFTPAYFLQAQIFERQGKRSLAIQKTEEARNLDFRDIGVGFQLGFLYYLDDRLNDARKEFERIVALNENYSNGRYFLGLIYDRQKEKDKAIAEFKKVSALNPDNEEVKKILENLQEGKNALDGIVPPLGERTETPIPETGGAKQETQIIPKKR